MPLAWHCSRNIFTLSVFILGWNKLRNNQPCWQELSQSKGRGGENLGGSGLGGTAIRGTALHRCSGHVQTYNLSFGPPRGGERVPPRGLGGDHPTTFPLPSHGPARQTGGRAQRQSLSAKGISLHFLNIIIYMMY